jgi:hypothetical protein
LRLCRYRFGGTGFLRHGWHTNRAALAAFDHNQTSNRDNEYRRGGA